jgi:hypothetical protein
MYDVIQSNNYSTSRKTWLQRTAKVSQIPTNEEHQT